MGRHFARHRRRVEHAAKTRLDPYGATNRAEYFAVVTEAFFERPNRLLQEAPEVYDELRKFYNQDPAALISGGDAA